MIGTGPNTSAIVLRPMNSLLAAYLGALADSFTEVLRTLAEAARSAAVTD